MTTATEPILSLDRIKEPIDAELKAFDKFFREAMRSKVGLVDLVARYVVRQKGKRVRPILVLLSAKFNRELPLLSHLSSSTGNLPAR